MNHPDDVVEMPVVVIGAGQGGLATGFHLRRAGLVPHRDFVILDADEHPGGAWSHAWDGLRLFSPARPASATLMGVGRTARTEVRHITGRLLGTSSDSR